MSDLATRAGRQLYGLLPEVYRSRDDGSLAAWLDSAGHLLDLVRNTLEQRLADSFPDEPARGRASQDWLLPYFAELLEPNLVSTDPRAQRAEVANGIAWRQRKGTLVSAEQIAEQVGGIEAEVQEGWKRVALTPRVGGLRSAEPPEAGRPFASALPAGTVDFGFPSRALRTGGEDPEAHISRFGGQTVPWRQAWAAGAPRFPGSYEDASARTVDLREPDGQRGHAHPRRLLFYYPPQGGFFPLGAPVVEWDAWATRRALFDGWYADMDAAGEDSHAATDGGQDVFLKRLAAPDSSERIQVRKTGELIGERITEPDGRVRSRLLMAGRWLERSTKTGEPVVYRCDGPPVILATSAGDETIVLPAGEPRIAFEGLSIDAVLRHQAVGGRLRFHNAAAREVHVGTVDAAEPVVDAVDSLFGSVLAPSGLIRLEYVTVLTALAGRRLQVSDALLAGWQPGFSADGGVSVIRYSRTPLPAEGSGLLAAFNTTEPPTFVELDFTAGGQTVRRPARFGEPGAGVLHPEAHRSLRFGAEDGGEMGACHGRRYSLAAEAVRQKLEDYLPVGLEAVLIPDPLLLVPPAPAD